MRIALVSYYAPPQPAVAAHRILRLTRVLRAHGHEVHWVTLATEKLPSVDQTLQELTPPGVVVHGLGGPTLTSKPVAANFPEKVLRTLAHHAPDWFGWPDRHVEWMWRLKKQLPKIAERAECDAVFISCGPHGQLLAVPRLRKRLPNLKIFVDYRDLLTGNVWTQPKTVKRRARLLARERSVLDQIDGLFVNTSQALTQFRSAVGETRCPVEVMRNGADYDLVDDLERIGVPAFVPEPKSHTHLGFFGNVFPRRRMAAVLAGLAELDAGDLAQVTLHCFGGNADSRALLDDDCKAVGEVVAARVQRHDALPFGEALRAMQAMTANVLVNGVEVEDNIFVPGKLYDYLMAQRPVLFVGGQGDARNIVASTSGDSWCHAHGAARELGEHLAGVIRNEHVEPVAAAAEFGPEASFAPLLSRLSAE